MHKHAELTAEKVDRPIILVGNPNVGKSVVFAHLTGRYAVVSNFPGTTVEISTGKTEYGGGATVIDTPGANSLQPHSMDERVTRDILYLNSPRVILQVADAKNLRRSLTITAQLAEMGLPVVVDLNMMDEARRRGVIISADTLAKKIGVPVVQTVATEKRGFKSLRKALDGEPAVPNIRVSYPEEIEAGIDRICALLPDTPISQRAVALMFLSNPREAAESLAEKFSSQTVERILEVAESVQAHFSNPLGYIIGISRSKVIDTLLDAVYSRGVSEEGELATRQLHRKNAYLAIIITMASLLLYLLAGLDNLGAWGLHPPLLHVVVIAFLIAVLPGRYFKIITTHPVWGAFFLIEVLYLMYKFVGVFGAGTLVDLIESRLFGNYLIPAITGLLGRVSSGGWFIDMLVGEYGLISMGITYAFAIVLPIVATFFFAFGILEDAGYLPRLAVIADKTMKRVGLNGKAVLPMVLGLGCDTMATLTTRILDTKKERIIATILLALAIPCSAQLGVIMAIVSATSVYVAVVVFVTVLLQLLIVGSLSARLIKGRRGDFIVELPPLRLPKLSNILIKTQHRLKWFLREAVPLFLIGTLILFVLDTVGGIRAMQKIAEPVIVHLLGLPIESTVAFIIGFFRRDYGAAGLYALFQGGQLNHNQITVAMVTITLFVPCVAHFLVMIKERGFKTALFISAFILPYAILTGTILNLILKLTRVSL
jgi:ferrous iron transport protein B